MREEIIMVGENYKQAVDKLLVPEEQPSCAALGNYLLILHDIFNK